MNRQERRQMAKMSGQRPAPLGKKWVKCVYPPCKQQVLVEDKAGPIVIGSESKETPPFCPYHFELIGFVLWLLPQVRMEKQRTPSGVILPGLKAFQMNTQEGQKQ